MLHLLHHLASRPRPLACCPLQPLWDERSASFATVRRWRVSSTRTKSRPRLSPQSAWLSSPGVRPQGKTFKYWCEPFPGGWLGCRRKEVEVGTAVVGGGRFGRLFQPLLCCGVVVAAAATAATAVVNLVGICFCWSRCVQVWHTGVCGMNDVRWE